MNEVLKSDLTLEAVLPLALTRRGGVFFFFGFCLFFSPPRAETSIGTREKMLLKEYRICMPLTVEEYRVGQLYMISKHSHEQSDRGEGVEVVQNEPYEDPNHGQGQFTEKRLYLNSKLPSWARAVVPKIFYVTEKAWNYYPYTVTEYTCSFLPKFSIHIETKYEDNKGSNDNIFHSELQDQEREVCFVDIAYDDLPERHYKEAEDLRYFKSEKTSRGLLQEGWIDTQNPIMCSYKLVTVKFEVWGLQTRVEQFVHKVIRDILLLGHRQAFAWVDEWIDMSLDDVRDYEKKMHEETNVKVCKEQGAAIAPSEQSAAIAPSEQSAANAPSEQSAAIAPSEQSAAIAPSEQSAANAPSEQSAANAPSEQSAANAPSEQSAANAPSAAKIPKGEAST
ncbi:cytoplasmic phosphatidylinositol transfer protein 1-like [Nerophis lumbriciformis]|uniref:cytoplasmic phosphatidylinositol transfer protein 1-like n=1 Tax=Nerophis lumbriciformis TaxID=546530 RepID=UPI003BAA926D